MNRPIIVTLVLSLLVPTSAFADSAPDRSPQPHPLKLRNVELGTGGTLSGQYLAHDGRPVTGAKITLELGGESHELRTDDDGRFSKSGLTGGRCIVRTDTEVFVCRLWAENTAPPGAIPSVAIVASEESLVRGNINLPPRFPGSYVLSGLSRGQIALLGLAVAGAAVGISEAVEDDDLPPAS